jgi:phenol hydroxylase P0 protein
MNSESTAADPSVPALDWPVDPVDGLVSADALRKFVRVIGRRANGLVVFEFSIGWPDLAAELVLPAPLFEEFCERHGAIRLPEQPREFGLPARPLDHDDDDEAGG